MGSELPEVALVAADGDPAHLVGSLLAPGWFDVLDLTETDRERPALYRTRALRTEFEGGFGSSEDYLQALAIELKVEPVSPFGVARVAQLAARTNQFNLTGIRFDETRTAAMASDPGHLVASLSVSDRFGDEGVVGALWVECGGETWRVLNMVLSCRVLSRGIELAAVDWLATSGQRGRRHHPAGQLRPVGQERRGRRFLEARRVHPGRLRRHFHPRSARRMGSGAQLDHATDRERATR